MLVVSGLGAPPFPPVIPAKAGIQMRADAVGCSGSERGRPARINLALAPSHKGKGDLSLASLPPSFLFSSPVIPAKAGIQMGADAAGDARERDMVVVSRRWERGRLARRAALARAAPSS